MLHNVVFHRMAHEINIFWASHSVHHSSEEMVRNLIHDKYWWVLRFGMTWIFSSAEPFNSISTVSFPSILQLAILHTDGLLHPADYVLRSQAVQHLVSILDSYSYNIQTWTFGVHFEHSKSPSRSSWYDLSEFFVVDSFFHPFLTGSLILVSAKS
jgi:hypothetical protein